MHLLQSRTVSLTFAVMSLQFYAGVRCNMMFGSHLKRVSESHLCWQKGHAPFWVLQKCWCQPERIAALWPNVSASLFAHRKIFFYVVFFFFPLVHHKRNELISGFRPSAAQRSCGIWPVNTSTSDYFSIQ